MPQLPPEPQSSSPLSAAWGRQLVRYLRAITPRNSPTVRVRMGAGGTTFDGAARARRGLAAATHPFRVTDASAGGTAKVRIQAGTVNNLMPTVPSEGDVSLAATPAPTPTVTHPHIVLKVTTDNTGAVTDAVMQNLASVPADTSTAGYLLIATLTIAGGKVTQVQQFVSTSVQHIMCGTATHRWGRV